MDRESRLLFSESVVTYALFRRIEKYSPERVSAVMDQLHNRLWGKVLISNWRENERFTQIWDALSEDVDDHETPLKVIFGDMSIEGNNTVTESYYAPEMWDESIKYPRYVKPSEGDLTTYWGNIADSWTSWISESSDDVGVRLSSFMEWSERWLSSVPVNRDQNVISLADHLKVMVAIASACGSNYSFQIVLGDLSGIQNYLFNISHIGAPQVAKRLRARSFILGLLSDAAVHKLLQEADLPIYNLLLSTGGAFYAVIPHSHSILKWQKEINDYLYHQYHGTITLHSASKKIDIKKLRNQNFSQVISDLHRQIQDSKGRPFAKIQQSNGKWLESTFLHDINMTTEPCNSCGRHPKKLGTDDLCEFCQLDEKVGRILPRTKYLIYKKGNGLINLFGDISIDLADELHASDTDGAYLIQGWNDVGLSNMALPVQRKWVANYVPTGPVGGCPHCHEAGEATPVKQGEPLTFKCIAHYAKGKNLLGFLKADVDNLGMLLSIGLRHDEKDKRVNTLSQLTSLSRLLERFFAGAINKWLNEEYRHVYTVFSGGDDLYLIGPWNDMIDLSAEIQQQFQKFTSYHSEITLSAAISIVKATAPVAHVSHEVERQLEKAKDVPNRQRINKKLDSVGRNQITLRRQTMEWSDLLQVNKQAKLLSKWLIGKDISSSYLYHLLRLSKLYEEYKSGELQGIKFVPLLKYYIDRNFNEKSGFKNRDVVNWNKQLLKVEQSDADWKWSYMKTIVELAHLYRSEKGDG